MTETPTLRIGELAERVGVSAKAIRYYEQLGLLPEPERSSRGTAELEQLNAQLAKLLSTARRLGPRPTPPGGYCHILDS